MIHVVGIPRISRFKEKLSGSTALKASATLKVEISTTDRGESSKLGKVEWVWARLW